MIRYSSKQEQIILAPYDHTIDWLEGTPRSGKTFAATQRFGLHVMQSRDTNHLVVAYSAEQAYRLIMEGDGHGLKHLFAGCCKVSHDDEGAHLLVNLPTGMKKIYWKGGGKADSHKSITGMSLGSVYFCEINLLHMDMIQECLRRTYAARDRWHIADCNPPAPQDPVITDVLQIQDCRFLHWTCADNPILSAQRLEEIKTACKKSPFLWKRDWLGERCIPQGVIYWMFEPRKHVISRPPENFRPMEMFFSGDGGTTDATSISCWVIGAIDKGYGFKPSYMMIHMGTWYYDGGQKAMSTQAKEICGTFIPAMRHKTRMREDAIYIDPACKALRLEMDKLGFYTSKADNNGHDIKGTSKGLMVGVEMLQSSLTDGRVLFMDDDQFGILPIIKEIGLYCMDDHGQPVDAYNHALDEIRYANNHFLKAYSLWG